MCVCMRMFFSVSARTRVCVCVCMYVCAHVPGPGAGTLCSSVPSVLCVPLTPRASNHPALEDGKTPVCVCVRAQYIRGNLRGQPYALHVDTPCAEENLCVCIQEQWAAMVTHTKLACSWAYEEVDRSV